MSQVASSPVRITWAARGMGALFVLAAFSQLKLQTVEQRGTLALAEKTRRFTLSRTDYARRGAILASDGKPLAQDEDATELNIQFSKIPKSEAFFLALGAATGIPASEFQALAASGQKQRTWRQPMSAEQSAEIARVKAEWRADGLSLARTGRRAYPLGDAAACVVGVVRQGKPVLGLEASKSRILTGEDGMRVGLTDKRGAFLPMRLVQASKERRDGSNITLTLDSDLQTEATDAVRKAVELNKADNGVALVMDPKTGNLIAMANWPSFSPYQPDGTEGDLRDNSGYNPSYMAQLEPGSTFKILTLAKALDVGAVQMGSIIHCSGEFHPTERTRIRCDSHHGNRAHGTIDSVKAIAKSCNVAAATWALKVHREPFLQYVRDLGLLSRSTLGVPGEAHGNFNYAEPAQQLQLATVGFGQSITCTPVTLLGAFGMLANGGVRMEPRLVERIGTTEMPIEPGKRLIKPETARELLQCMEAVIETDAGTGKELRIPGYRLGGKTGTAQKVGKGPKGYVSNFVGFVPADDPKAVILVMVNNPKGGKYYGATVAGPVFKRLAQAVIRRYHLPPSKPLNQKEPISVE
ncbi:peptidoglycan D,D-transpeptidase FtsI family protein [Fimbriimonas ginsengisoli]|uniref:Putative penicillin-binding protein n=1 Tax=Fimbriimonas ginsengisoli Gsoil 348 TaxID=661478 RepID=A0A068NYI1_FIMGI|nr:penicillin-binding protein 2 [Fimbriimonas ginsengisoli]AIE88160.1 putative penicillin-binding protein [Fimbriimonas ginsengisoli Gsoil 348]